jgi:hypothetical protein
MLNARAPTLVGMPTIIKVDEIVNPSKYFQRHVGDASLVGFVANTHVFNFKQVSEPISKYGH